MCLVRSVTYVSGRSLLCLTTYVLRSKATCCLYTGSTSDLVRRLEQHNADVSTSTKHRGPWELVHREDFFGFHFTVQHRRQSRSQRWCRIYLLLYFGGLSRTPGHFQIVDVLQIEPKLSVCMKVPC
jgi:predicted GIY-YIG superfamily endonuclease